MASMVLMVIKNLTFADIETIKEVSVHEIALLAM